MFYITLALLCSTILCSPKLVNVQVIFRHGDRTPTNNIPSDPYQLDFWGLPWGSLTTVGMEQQLQNGLRLKNRYIMQLKFVNATYSPYEVSVLSAQHDRCLQSAEAHFAGFYSDSKFHPTDKDWPGNLTPLPIHTITSPDQMLEPGNQCPRAQQLQAIRLSRPEYLSYEQLYIQIVQEFAAKTSQPWTKYWDIISYLGTLRCEVAHNLTLPNWITPQLYNTAVAVRSAILDYTYGMASLGVPADDEQIRIRGGLLLKTILSNLRQGSGTRYLAYSAHDSTLVALLYALGPNAKYAAMGDPQPPYAATLIFETYLMDDGSYSVTALFGNSATDNLKTITNSFSGCQNYNQYCPVSSLTSQVQKYIVEDITKECAAK